MKNYIVYNDFIKMQKHCNTVTPYVMFHLAAIRDFLAHHQQMVG